MYKYHTTRGGESMLVCEMTDSHLINTINLKLRKLEGILAVADQLKDSDEYQRHLYNRQNIDPGMAADATKEIANQLEPYIMEAVLRNIDDQIRNYMQIVFGRKEAVPKIGKIMLLNSSDVDVDEILHGYIDDLNDDSLGF